MAEGMAAICDDLRAEHQALDDLVAGLDDSGWDLPTPAAPWAIRDQIGHLAYYDRMAFYALTGSEAFDDDVELISSDPVAYVERAQRIGREFTGEPLLGLWREGRDDLLRELRAVDPRARVPWYGPPMSALSFATARLMETWAHGTDVADALGTSLPVTGRLRHVAHIGVRARPFSYVSHGLEVPDGEVFVSLDPPDGGAAWTWGDPASDDRVEGPALDFCLVVTQRRVVGDSGLKATGDLAREWLAIAQAFAGPPTTTAPSRRGLGARA